MSKPTKKRDLAELLVDLCRRNGIPTPVREYEFASGFGRDFRLDAAWINAGVALEIHGGVWTGGRHATGAGVTIDCEKGRYMAILGFRLLAFTGTEFNEAPDMVVACIKAALLFEDVPPSQAFDRMATYSKALRQRQNKRARRRRAEKKVEEAAVPADRVNYRFLFPTRGVRIHKKGQA